MNQSHVSVLEIDLNALKYNINYFKNKLTPSVKLMAVVKAFAYGHDAIEIAKFLEKNKIDCLAVAYTSEGVILREAGIKLPILILHPQIPNLENLIAYNLEPNIYSNNTLDAFIKIATRNQLENYPIHLKFNTGLNRLGFTSNEVDAILNTIKKSSCVKIKSIFSHLAASEDLNEFDFTKNQIHKFQQIANNISKKLNYTPILHLTNTSGVINYPDAHFDMVRIGIGMYGFGNDSFETSQLKNVGSLKSIISQIHKIEVGETIGYNRAFKTSKKTSSATIPIGHADGISRKLGNGNGFVTIQNKKCPIIGNVCMDMIMVDITDIDCNEGDEVILFDNQESLNELALKSGTISYEILTGISQRISRKIIFNS